MNKVFLPSSPNALISLSKSLVFGALKLILSTIEIDFDFNLSERADFLASFFTFLLTF